MFSCQTSQTEAGIVVNDLFLELLAVYPPMPPESHAAKSVQFIKDKSKFHLKTGHDSPEEE